MTTQTYRYVCRHCGRPIERDNDGVWVDPAATGDDSTWRETCDRHDTFIADHEPGTGLYTITLTVTVAADSIDDANDRLYDLFDDPASYDFGVKIDELADFTAEEPSLPHARYGRAAGASGSW